MKTSELTGAALDWAVAKCEGFGFDYLEPIKFIAAHLHDDFNFSTDWAQGGPIIERECIELAMYSDEWMGVIHMDDGSIEHKADKPLIAAMRCYVASKLGDTVEIPEELTK